MSENRPKIHVWITKYALTDGVYEADVEQCIDINPKMISVGRNGCHHKPDWHTSEAEAKARVEAMIEDKAKSLRKSLAKMDKLRTKVSEDFGSLVKRKEGA